MARITFDTQQAFLIPDDKREEYFEWMNVMAQYNSRAMNLNNVTQAWNTDIDPIIVADREFFTEKNWLAIEKFMKQIGATDVTHTLS